jgi:PAS domain S-box-containing protein
MHPVPDHEKELSGGAEAILESITDAFFALNSSWEFTYVNHQAENVLGRERGDLLGKNLWLEFPGLAGSEFERAYREAAAEHIPGSITSYYPDHERWYEAHCYPAQDGISIYFRNVTERVRAEEKLRESETRFRVLTNVIPQIVWITDADGRVEFFSQQWSAYTGLPFNPETANEVFSNLIHPDDRASTLAAWDAARRDGRSFSVEHRIRSASGAYRWFLARAEAHQVKETGQTMRWFGTSTDVHDHKRAEAAIQRSEARYRTLFESIDEGFCIIEILVDDAGKPHDYRFLEINPTFEQQTGLRDAVGRTMRELAPGHEEHWFRIYGDVASTGTPIRFENEAKALNRWYDVYAFRVEEPSARKVAILFKDTTLRKRTEEEMRVANQRKDEFLAMLAHELRNPLAPISAAADLLSLARLDEERVKQTSETISRQVHHMTSLIDDLLDVSRVTRGLIMLDKDTLDAKQIVTDAVEQIRPLIEARRHHLAMHTWPESALVIGDRKRLVQVIANLLNNAAKYTPEGGTIVLAIEVHEERVLITVADNGIGMTPELVARAFELFAQGERTPDRSQGGLGVGLAVVKSLVELHRGTVGAESKGQGQGSKFTICLPRIAKPDEPLVLPQRGKVPASSRRLRLMVVDDNADAASMLAMYLEAAGHEVIVEYNPTTALERARIEMPDVCLLDIGLPGMDGNELARRIRAQPETARSVLVAVTGYGQEQDKNNAAAAGFDYHFVKPVDSARLASLLAELSATSAPATPV